MSTVDAIHDYEVRYLSHFRVGDTIYLHGTDFIITKVATDSSCYITTIRYRISESPQERFLYVVDASSSKYIARKRHNG